MDDIYFEDTAAHTRRRGNRFNLLKPAAVAVFIAAVLLGLNFIIKKQIAAAAVSAAAAAEARTGAKITYNFGGSIFTGFCLSDITLHIKEAGPAPVVTIDKVKLPIPTAGVFEGRIGFDRIDLVKPVVNIDLSTKKNTDYAGIIDKIFGPGGGGDFRSNRIAVSGGEIHIAFRDRLGHADGIVFKGIRGEIARGGGPGAAKVGLTAELGGAAIKIRGAMRTGADSRLDLRWSSGNLFSGGPPPVTAGFAKLAKRWELGGAVRARGRITGAPGNPEVTAHFDFKGAGAFGLDIGNGGADAVLRRGALKFTGAAGSLRARRVSAEVVLLFGNKPAADVKIGFSGFDADAVLSNAAPELPKLVEGPAGGAVHLYGKSLVSYNLKLDADLMFMNGRVMYPTPAFSGQTNAWAPVGFSTLSMRLTHERPQVALKEVHLSGPDIVASGSATFIYGKNYLTDEPAGPFRFDARAAFSSRNILTVVLQNKYLGSLISGAATGAVEIRGRSDRPESFGGGFSFTVTNGAVSSPYDPEGARYPPDARPAHFSFDLLTGNFKLGAAAAATDDFHLRGRTFNADMFGFAAFDGSIKARAETGVNPEMIPYIQDFLEDYKKVKPDVLKGVIKVKTAFEVAGTIRNPSMKWDMVEFEKSVSALQKSYDEIQMMKKVESAKKLRRDSQPRKTQGKTKRRSSSRHGKRR